MNELKCMTMESRSNRTAQYKNKEFKTHSQTKTVRMENRWKASQKRAIELFDMGYYAVNLNLSFSLQFSINICHADSWKCLQSLEFDPKSISQWMIATGFHSMSACGYWRKRIRKTCYILEWNLQRHFIFEGTFVAPKILASVY